MWHMESSLSSHPPLLITMGFQCLHLLQLMETWQLSLTLTATSHGGLLILENWFQLKMSLL